MVYLVSKIYLKNEVIKLSSLDCPVKTTVNLISGKWKPVILFRLLNGKMRFSEIQRHLESITHKSLANQLQGLEKDGLITRTVYPVVPPKVEYELTDLGMSMKAILLAMYVWGAEYDRRDQSENDGDIKG